MNSTNHIHQHLVCQPLGASDLLSIVAISLIGSVGAVAIPSIGVVFLVVILETIAVPVAGVALVLGVDRLLDMLRTTTNVTGDAVVAACMPASIKNSKGNN